MSHMSKDKKQNNTENFTFGKYLFNLTITSGEQIAPAEKNLSSDDILDAAFGSSSALWVRTVKMSIYIVGIP